MEFHAQKCQVMHVTKKGNPMKKNYTIHGVTLQETIGAKYQNVSLHKSLSWKNHIDQVAKKANSTRAFLQRNTKQTKELCYKTLMRPIIEYASVIWGPFTVDDIRKLGMIQRRSVRFVMVASQKCWTSSTGRRCKNDEHRHGSITKIYRIVHGHGSVRVPSTLLIPTVSLRGHDQTFLVLYARTMVYQKSFFPDTTRLWNNLTCLSLQLCAQPWKVSNIRYSL